MMLRMPRRELGLLPPPLWGRVGEEGPNLLLRWQPPPSLSLPLKGGGDHGARPRCPNGFGAR
jgi:hypothetical protein